MSAAWRLVQAGHTITLVERRPYLGGRAYSFVDRETDEQIDNGQHVFLGCCTAFVQLLDDIGSLELAARQNNLRAEVYSPDGTRGLLSAMLLPPPLHLFPSFLRYPHITWRDKLRALPALARIWMKKELDNPELQRNSFLAWLKSNGQSEQCISNFWDLLIVPTLNDDSGHVSASAAFMVFQEALLRNAQGGAIGFARGSLSELIGHRLESQLLAAGATLKLGSAADRFEVEGRHVKEVVLRDGTRLCADAYISALPPSPMLEMLPEHVRKEGSFRSASSHTWAPIVNLHIWYNQPIGDFEFVAFVNSPVQWVFNRSQIARLPGPGQHITISLSAAWAFWKMPKHELREVFIRELQRLFPLAKEAEVVRFVIVKERNATFRSLPGSAEHRLPCETSLSNFFLAGDWTATGWPSTMEGAVRSGNRAANAIAKFVSS